MSSTEPFDPVMDDRITPLHRATNPKHLIELNNGCQPTLLRDQLSQYIWGPEGREGWKLPHELRVGIRTEYLKQMRDVARVDEVLIHLGEPGMSSHGFVVHPVAANGSLIVYQHGHTHWTETRNLQRLLDEGYALYVLWMPLLGPNPRSAVYYSPRFGALQIAHHNDLALLEPTLLGSPVRFFLEPVLGGIDIILERFDYRLEAMVGLSGGGWTTTLAAALDIRLKWTYPVSGTLPTWLRSGAGDWRSGDYEENLPGLYAIADYMDLYCLGSWEHRRHQLQILNRYDPVCFSGMRHELYVGAVQEVLALRAHGTFRVHLNQTHRSHSISPASLSLIVDDLNMALSGE